MARFLEILAFITLSQNTNMTLASMTCSNDHGELSCNNITSEQDIPHVAPIGVHTVYLQGSSTIEKLESSPFRSVSWENVSELHIHTFVVIRFIYNNFLAGLKGLKLLSVSKCQYLKVIEEELLKDTPELEALYLDWLPSMTMSQVEKLLHNSVPNLRYLSLIAINTMIATPFILGNEFIKAVGLKKLTFIDVSQSHFAGVSVSISLLNQSLVNLQYLNVSNTPISTAFIEVSLVTLSLLDVIDVSGCLGGPSLVPRRPDFRGCLAPYIKFRYGFIDQMKDPWDRPVQLDRTFTSSNPKGCTVENLQLIDWSKNRLNRLNITFTGRYIFINVIKFDLSNNNMEYLGPSFLSAFPALKVINLDGNSLGKMEHMDDYEKLFKRMSSIEIINLRYNGLTRLPVNFGHENKELRILDLKGNRLSHFEMAIYAMKKLVFIDLSDNHIEVLSNDFIDNIQFIKKIQQSNNYLNSTWPRERDSLYYLQKKNIRIDYAYNSTRNLKLSTEGNDRFPETFTIGISGNLLQCSCENVYFPKWIISSDVSLLGRESLDCIFYDEKIDINQDLIDKIQFRCKLPRTIAIIVTVCIACCAGIMLLFVIIFRQRKKARRQYVIMNLKKEIRERKLSYIVFVSCSSDDQETTDKCVVPVINAYLKEKLEAIQDLAVTGMETIVPGRMLMNEIYRCIEGALVVVLLVTENFLESDWCNLESLVAKEYKIPLIILIQEGTRCETKSKTINYALSRFGRAEWSIKNGQFVIRPAWNVICDGILSCAAESILERKEKKERKRENLRKPLIENINIELV
ncbi:hypothetical protein ACJMK2_041129 [Sinanodonta woodiana]|uniref:TIR domain-containing protein n=1 Tax=Sinanodonta woodiana TaxID=1069815 RepID=A0ABD3W427_SINWO